MKYLSNYHVEKRYFEDPIMAPFMIAIVTEMKQAVGEETFEGIVEFKWADEEGQNYMKVLEQINDDAFAVHVENLIYKKKLQLTEFSFKIKKKHLMQGVYHS